MQKHEILGKQNQKLKELANAAEFNMARRFGTRLTKTSGGYMATGYEWRGNFYPIAVVPVNKLSEAIKFSL